MAITRLPGGALTPKRPLDESFDQLDGPIVSAAYSSHLNLFYFFKDNGAMFIYRLVAESACSFPIKKSVVPAVKTRI